MEEGLTIRRDEDRGLISSSFPPFSYSLAYTIDVDVITTSVFGRRNNIVYV